METADFEVNFALENFSQNDENNRNVANTSHDETFEDARGDNQRGVGEFNDFICGRIR